MRDDIGVPSGRQCGKVGVSLPYKWIDARGYRDAWDHSVRFKERLRQDELNRVELDVPEIDWDLWPQECTSDAHNTARAVKAGGRRHRWMISRRARPT